MTPSSDLTANGFNKVVTVATNTLGIGCAMTINSSSEYEEAIFDGSKKCRGLALETGTGEKHILLQGVLKVGTFSFTPNATLYLSDTLGELTETEPILSGYEAQRVGYAITASTIYFNPEM